MSKQNLRAFLTDLKTNVLKKNKYYRRDVADRRTHLFSFSFSEIVKQTQRELQHRQITEISNSDLNQVLKNSGILTDLRMQAQKVRQQRELQPTIRSNQYSIKVQIEEEINPKSRSQTNKAFSNFAKLKTLYATGLQKYVDLLVQHAASKNITIKRVNQRKLRMTGEVEFYPGSITRSSDLFQAGHEKGEGVLDTELRDAVERAGFTAYDNMDYESVIYNLQAAGVDVTYIRNDINDTQTIVIESLIDNQLDGLGVTGARKQLLDQIEDAILAVDGKGSFKIMNIRGSDTAYERQVKKVQKKLEKDLGGIKGAKYTNFDTNLKKGTKRSVTDKDTVKRKRANSAPLTMALKAPKGKTTRRAKKSLTSIQRLVGILNTQLPRVVAKNMGDPRLNNRSGRFAGSVRITDVGTTPQGFPSIGYTYMKNPYQTYETGFKQGDPERDPRKLIDMSIREIASSMAMGRFYTRRV